MNTPKMSYVQALAVVALGLALAAYLTHAATVSAPLFPRPLDVPSVSLAAPSTLDAAAVERVRLVVRRAVSDQNLPGVSVAVGADGRVAWAEGFGWRDVVTETPVTPDTRFNIGTAAAVVAAAVAPLRLTSTGSDSAADWSPEAIGEPGEDFPLFTLIRHVVLQPIGLAPAEYPLPGDRATFYVPSADANPAAGRRLMPMRDLACCANGTAFYSTPSDLVRVALTAPSASINGELAGGRVLSLMVNGDGLVVAVTSNIAHADTLSLARRVSDAVGQAR